MATEKDMQNAFHRSNFRNYELIGINTFLTLDYSEMDICGLSRAGLVSEVEIKRSVGSFKRDFDKVIRFSEGHPDHGKILKHDEVKAGRTNSNYFSFLLPEGLVDKCDIPEYAGLYVYRINDNGYGVVQKEKSPPLLHKRTINHNLRYNIALGLARKFWDNKHDMNKD